MVTPIYTIKRASANYQAKPTGRINGDFREYACSFFAPDDTGEIHVRIGLYGNVKAESSAVFRDMKLEPLTEPGDEIKPGKDTGKLSTALIAGIAGIAVVLAAAVALIVLLSKKKKAQN